MNTKEKSELLIWTPDGAWFQFQDDRGQIRSSYLGILSRVSVEQFARENGFAVEVWEERWRKPGERLVA